MPCTIIISRSETPDPARRAFEDAIISEIVRSRRASVLVTPAVYALTAEHKALAALAELKGNLVVASWLHPRAMYWLLHARGILGGAGEGEGCADCDQTEACFACRRKIFAYNLAAFESPEAAVRRLLAWVPAGRRRSPTVTEIAEPAAPRWYPVIDYSLCAVCGQCHDFCLFGVYSTGEGNKPLVTTPDACKPGCAACARVCPNGAIMFPLHEADPGIAGAPGCKPKRDEDEAAESREEHKAAPPRDELDDLIDRLDKLDV